MAEWSTETNPYWDEFDKRIARQFEAEIKGKRILATHNLPVHFHGSVSSEPDFEVVYPPDPTRIVYYSTGNCLYGSLGWVNHFYTIVGVSVEIFVTRGRMPE